jgi:hypothetical protein
MVLIVELFNVKSSSPARIFFVGKPTDSPTANSAADAPQSKHNDDPTFDAVNEEDKKHTSLKSWTEEEEQKNALVNET